MVRVNLLFIAIWGIFIIINKNAIVGYISYYIAITFINLFINKIDLLIFSTIFS